MTRRLPALCFVALGALGASQASPPDGRALFDRECATCHTGEAGSRAPAREVLRERSPEAILFALTAGGMRPFGAHLSGVERRVVAEYLSGKPISGDVTGSSVGRCSAASAFSLDSSAPGWNGWSPTITNTRFQSAAGAGLTGAGPSTARAEVGIRLSRRDLGVVAADRCRRTHVRRAARTALYIPSTPRADASSGHSAPRAVCGPPSPSGRAEGAPSPRTSATLSPPRMRSTQRQGRFSGPQGRHASPVPHHGNARAATGNLLYVPHLLVRGNDGRESAVRVLHVSR